MNSIQYATDYIRRVTTSDTIEPPSPDKAGEYFETLQALHENHCAGGPRAALAGWNGIKKFVPDLAKKRKLINFHELDFLQIPEYALPESEESDIPNYAIYRLGLNMLYGNPGGGKSFVAIDIAARIALHNPDRIVVYAAGEGKHGMSGRLKAWEQHYNLKVNNLYLWMDALPFLDSEEVHRFMEEIDGKQPCFIIVDTLARSMLGINENDTKETGLYIDAVERAMEELGCGVLLIHHTNKMGIMRGSTVLNGALDSVLRLDKQENLITIFNNYDRGGKNKHREEAPPIFLRLLPVKVDQNDEAVIVPSARIIDDGDDLKLSEYQAEILKVLLNYEDGTTGKVICDTTSIAKATVYRNLNRMLKRELVAHEPEHEIYKITQLGERIIDDYLDQS